MERMKFRTVKPGDPSIVGATGAVPNGFLPPYLVYEGPNGPAYAAWRSDKMATAAFGPMIPSSSLAWGGLSDSKTENLRRLKDGVTGRVGDLELRVKQKRQGVLRGTRAIRVSLGSHKYVLRARGLASIVLERDAGGRVARFRSVALPGSMAADAEPSEVALVVLLDGARLVARATFPL